ncbi:ribonuclease HII [Clostridium rectalis]|uniref:ribonuclease HII n=1 Tax=Clostridium rectalis TaxID=2040295 RepID=UPI000F63143A|nr:ribonuclease HII [Clostridium rectalis]
MDINQCFQLKDKMTYAELKSKTDMIKKHYNNENKNTLLDIAHYLNKDKRKNVKGLSESIIKFLDKYEKEYKRVKTMYAFDKSFGEFKYIAGVDEVGRGPLAGPIVAAAVILDLDKLTDKDLIFGIKDSKKLSAKNRQELAEIIKKKAICYNLWAIDNKGIDSSGISWCNNEVLKNASLNLKIKPNFVISDGYAIRNIGIKNKFIIKGDAKSASIACASIIAKVYRDKLMEKYSKEYSYYDFQHNFGYGTSKHIDGLKKFGPCNIHRRSFLGNIL